VVLVEKFTFEKLDAYLKGLYNQTFNAFARYELSQAGYKYRHKSQHNATLDYLDEYAPDTAFSQVDYNFVRGFNRFLQNKGLKDSTIYGHEKRLRHHLIETIRQGYIKPEKDPYYSYKIKPVKYETVRYLEESELKKLENIDLAHSPSIERVRDFFIFSCYTGLSFSDAANFNKSHIKRESGEAWVSNPRIKTGNKLYPVLFRAHFHSQTPIFS